MNAFCLFCGKPQDMLDIPPAGTFKGLGHLYCHNCNAEIKVFIENYPKKKIKLLNMDNFFET